MVLIKFEIDSKNSNFAKGDFVFGMLKWKEFQTSAGTGLNKVDPEKAPLSAYLGILGLTGLTAYISLEKIADLKEGETLLVSGASGAVGSTVGQIGKIKGCRVVGIAGSDEKLDLMKDKFGFDEGINYKKTDDMIFYLPVYFYPSSSQRDVLVTPFQKIVSTTNDPFNVQYSFGVGGKMINLENSPCILRNSF